MFKIEMRVLPKTTLNIDDRFNAIRYPEADYKSQFYQPLLGIEKSDGITIIGNSELLPNISNDKIGVFITKDSPLITLVNVLSEYYSTQRSLNIIEKINLLKLGDDLGISQKDIAKNICPQLNLPPLVDSVRELLFAYQLPLAIKRFIFEKSMSLKQLVVFLRCGDSFNWVLKLVEDGKVSLGILLEIINTVWEISKRDERTVESVLMEVGINDFANSNELPSIRAKLYRLRYPVLNQTNEKIEEIIKSFQFPWRINISWDRSFEREGFEIKIKAGKVDELNEAVRYIEKADMEHLFEKINF